MLKKADPFLEIKEKNGKSVELILNERTNFMVYSWLSQNEIQGETRKEFEAMENLGALCLATFDYFLEKWDGKMIHCKCEDCLRGYKS